MTTMKKHKKRYGKRQAACRAGDSRPGCWRESSPLACFCPAVRPEGESSGSVSESTAGSSSESAADSVSTLLEITDPEEKAAVEAAKGKVAAMDGEPRIIATSPATAEICDRLDLDLIGVCSSTISELPERYSEVTQVGTSMAPDMEIVDSLNPDWILSPASLQSDLQPKYEAIDTDWGVSKPAERAGHVPFHSGAGRDFRQAGAGPGAGE